MVVAFEVTTAPVSICFVLQLKTKDNTKMSRGNILQVVMRA